AWLARKSIGTKPPPSSRRRTTSEAPVLCSMAPTVAAGVTDGSAEGGAAEGPADLAGGGDEVPPPQAAMSRGRTIRARDRRAPRARNRNGGLAPRRLGAPPGAP